MDVDRKNLSADIAVKHKYSKQYFFCRIDTAPANNERAIFTYYTFFFSFFLNYAEDDKRGLVTVRAMF